MARKLTTAERKFFDAQQLTELDRMSANRMDELLGAPDRDGVVAKLAIRPAATLRCRVNVIKVIWGTPSPNQEAALTAEGLLVSRGDGFVVVWAPESNYTDGQKAAVGHDLAQGHRWMNRVPEIVERPSLTQRIAALEA